MVPRLDLAHVVLRLSGCRSLEQIIATLRDSARALVGSDGVTIVLRDVDKCFYVEEDAIGPLWRGQRFPMSSCISGWCMIHREQVIIPDIYKDDRIPHDAYRPTFVKSLAMTPIRSADPVGAIGAYWAEEYTPTADQLNILQALGDSAAIALENAQLIQALTDAGQRKDAFLSMLAHELRNPLAPVRSGLHLLKLQGEQPEVVAETTEMMERQVTHMSRIVDDLLDVARINNGKVKLSKAKIDFANLVRQCVEDRVHGISTANLSLNVDCPAQPIWVDVDPTLMTQIIGNLLDNARKYTPAGGKISVSTRVDDATQTVRLTVDDTGVGIAPAVLPHVFESFMQADTSLDRTAGGLGLGLAIANGLVKLHDGVMSAFSDGLGRGSRFTVTLPCVKIAPVSTTPSPTVATIDKKLRLLIIEDNKDAAVMLQKLLKACGYAATIAHDGGEGVDRAHAEKPDVILCDIGLPTMDGYAVASTLRRSDEMANTRLIAVTGYGNAEDQERSRSAGFDAHLVKPINLQDLLGHLKNLN